MTNIRQRKEEVLDSTLDKLIFGMYNKSMYRVEFKLKRRNGKIASYQHHVVPTSEAAMLLFHRECQRKSCVETKIIKITEETCITWTTGELSIGEPLSARRIKP